jgi:hypothetical protein
MRKVAFGDGFVAKEFQNQLPLIISDVVKRDFIFVRN